MEKIWPAILCAFVVALISMICILAYKIDCMQIRIDEADARIVSANARIDSLSKTLERTGRATDALFSALNDGARRYAEKIEAVDNDDDACDWLDDVLPDSVRSLYGCGASNHKAAKLDDSAMQKDGAGKDGN